jgi:hypothetical protein
MLLVLSLSIETAVVGYLERVSSSRSLLLRLPEGRFVTSVKT